MTLKIFCINQENSLEDDNNEEHCTSINLLKVFDNVCDDTDSDSDNDKEKWKINMLIQKTMQRVFHWYLILMLIKMYETFLSHNNGEVVYP